MATPGLIFANESFCHPNASIFADRLSSINADVPINATSSLPTCQNGSCRCAFEAPVFHSVSNAIQYLAFAITFFNIIAHLISAVVFLELIRGRDLAQQNHHLLFILSIFEMVNAFFSELKPVLSYAGAFFSPIHSFDSLADLKVSYYITMLLNGLTSTSYFCRNWWLVVIAMTRSVTVVRLQRILKNADGMQTSGTLLKSVNTTAFIVFFAGMTVALLVHGVIVPIRLQFYLCTSQPQTQWPPESDVPNRIHIRHIKVINAELPQLVRVLVDLLHEVLVLVLPIVIMAAATVVIWISLRRLSRGPCLVPNQRMQMMGRVTRLIAILLTVFVILEPLSPICFLIRRLISRTEQCWIMGINYILLPISELLVALDSTTNLVVYYLWDKSFRHNLQRHLQRRCPKCLSLATSRQRQNRRDTYPTTLHAAATGPSAMTYCNASNIGGTTNRENVHGNFELHCTVQPLLGAVEDEREIKEDELPV